MNKWWVAFGCAMFACTAAAQNIEQVRASAEASMIVSGWINVNPDGSVHDYTVDHIEKLPPDVAGLIQQNVAQWRFKARNGTDASERARMSMRIVSRRLDDKHDSMQITGATFGDTNPTPGRQVAEKR